MNSALKEYLVSAALLAFGIVGWHWSTTYRGHPAARVAQPVPTQVRGVLYPTGPALTGTVLPRASRVLCAPQGGHVHRVYFSAGQTMRRGDVLLKMVVGPGHTVETVFDLAPTTGEVVSLGVRSGAYLSAGAPYARLELNTRVRVQVRAAAAAHLGVGDTLRVLAGPADLRGATPVITALLRPRQGAPAGTAILVFRGLNWSRPTTTDIVLTPVRSRPRHLLAGD